MSKAKLSQIKIPPEARKFPFDQTFLCPKCSEILFVKIHYIDATMIPQVKYKCPKRHSGTVDLLLFFNLFHSSNKEIEEELSKFDEKLEKDIEIFKTKKMKERKKILDPVNFAKIINKKNKEKEEEQNKEKNNNEENENKNKEEIKQEKEKEEDNKKLFVEIQKCNEIKFSLLNIKKEVKEPKIIEKHHPKSESKTAEKVEENSPETQNKPKKVIKSNKNSFSPKSKVNNINIIKKENSKEKKKEEEKEDSKEKEKEKEEIKKEEAKLKEQKETKEDKFTCSLHGNRFTGYCFSCKKDMCKKCFKKRGHKKRKIFSNVLLSEKNLNELNRSLNLCQESLNKFENKAHSLMDELGNKERNEKIILNIMSKAFIDINRENLKEIREVIKTYVNCVKKNMLNYEIIMNVKNLNIKNVIIVPKDISELIKVLKNYKNYIIQKNLNKKTSTEDDDKSKENKYLQLFNAFFELLKNYENKEINFKEIVEDESFRKLINSNDYGNIDLNKEDSNKIVIEEEKELNDIDNNIDEYDMNYEYEDNYEDCFEEEEENENEIEYEDDYEEEYNDEDLEEDCMYAINENKKNEQNEQNENEDTK